MNRRTLLTAINVAIYVIAAIIIFGWLTIRASNGGIFSRAAGTYEVVVPSAPGVESNSTSVITESGVEIGVVTGVELAGDGARIELKVTDPGPVRLKSDASAQVVIRNIIGEKAVLVFTGEDEQEADDGATLAASGDGTILEASQALAPLEDARALSEDPAVESFVKEQQAVVDESAAQSQAILGNVQSITDMLAAQDVALGNIGRRSGDMLAELASHGGDIQYMVDQSAKLANDVETLLDNELGVVEKGFTVAADALTMIGSRAAEMNQVLQRLPEIADDTSQASAEFLRIVRNERGHGIVLGAVNLPDLGKVLQILKEGN